MMDFGCLKSKEGRGQLFVIVAGYVRQCDRGCDTISQTWQSNLSSKEWCYCKGTFNVFTRRRKGIVFHLATCFLIDRFAWGSDTHLSLVITRLTHFCLILPADLHCLAPQTLATHLFSPIYIILCLPTSTSPSLLLLFSSLLAHLPFQPFLTIFLSTSPLTSFWNPFPGLHSHLSSPPLPPAFLFSTLNLTTSGS